MLIVENCIKITESRNFCSNVNKLSINHTCVKLLLIAKSKNHFIKITNYDLNEKVLLNL